MRRRQLTCSGLGGDSALLAGHHAGSRSLPRGLLWGGVRRVPVGGILPGFTPLGKQRKQKRVEGEAGLQDWGTQPSQGRNAGDVSRQ